MAESPASDHVISRVEGTGRFAKGSSANPGGRTPLPECFTSLEPLALAGIAAMATGVVLEELVPDGLSEEDRNTAIALLKADAAETPRPMRLEARTRMVERVRGRPKETVNVNSSHSEITRVEMVVIRKTEPQQKAIGEKK